jgi:hypothetical protein
MFGQEKEDVFRHVQGAVIRVSLRPARLATVRILHLCIQPPCFESDEGDVI